MRPLRVRANLRSRLALPRAQDVHLDALLQWVWVMRHDRHRGSGLSRSSTRGDVTRGHLPVEHVQIGDHRVYLCSAWEFPGCNGLGTTQWTRRKDGEDMYARARRLDSSSPERPQLNVADSIATPWVEWVCWGQRRELRKSLALVHHIGGLRAHGYGAVDSWDVTEDASIDIVDIIQAEDGTTRRALPAEAVASCSPADVERLAVEPPYWLPAMHTQAIRAGSSAVLRPDFLDDVKRVAESHRSR